MSWVAGSQAQHWSGFTYLCLQDQLQGEGDDICEQLLDPPRPEGTKHHSGSPRSHVHALGTYCMLSSIQGCPALGVLQESSGSRHEHPHFTAESTGLRRPGTQVSTHCYGRLSLEDPLPVYHTFTFHACGHAGVCIHA